MPAEMPAPASSPSELQNNELVFPASMDQEAFFYMEKLARGIAPFNIAIRFQLLGPLDRNLLKSAFQRIAERHEILRTHFEDAEDSLVQVVLPEVDIPVRFADLSELPKSEREPQLRALGIEEAETPFDLSGDSLLRALLVRTNRETHILHVSVHHSAADGWSIGILANELARQYTALAAREPDPLPPPPIQYADFAIWQREFLAGPEIGTQMNYWKDRLHGMSDLDLPVDHTRPATKQWRGNILSRLLPEELSSRLQSLATERGLTLFHVFLAAFKVLLHRSTGSTDIAIGSPVAGRNRPELEPLIGTFINTLILRTDLSGDPNFHHLLERVKETALGALAHQDLPFEALVRELRPTRDPSRNPLFQVNFTHQRDFVKAADMGPLQLTAMPSVSPGTIFDLHFFMVERDGIWRMSCEYSCDLFEESTAQAWLQRYHTLLENLVADPDKPISQLPILSPEESAQLAGWQQPSAPYPSERSLGQHFSEIATRYPDNVALAQGEKKVSYEQAHGRACQIALALQEQGVLAGTLVGLALPPSPEMVIGLLGILLAGGAYVPIDTGYPEDRLRQLIDDTDLQVIVTDPATVASLPEGKKGRPEVILVQSNDESPMPVPIEVADHSSRDPAYLLFTSGSTGHPKGVLVPHQAVLRLVCDTNYMDFGPEEVFLLAAPMSFDASTFELWGALLHGATLTLPRPGAFGLSGIARSVREEGVTTLWLTAGLFQVMIEEHLEDLRGLRNLLAGGDVLPTAQVRAALEGLPDTRLINGYGPTENTTFTTCHTLTKRDLKLPSIPIGRPIANTSVWILDPNGRQVPMGVPGELHTGGDGLALGYWRDPELSAKRFVRNPCPEAHGEIVFRTGDLARWRSDGTIEFLGRLDRQVKVRGCRVEPAEVEAVLGTHPAIGQARVAVTGDGAGDKKLTAWLSPLPGHSLNQSEIASFLAGKLPPFLCPDLLVLLDALPLNANGKIDMDALPNPHSWSENGNTASSEPPETKTEQMLAATCSQLLGLSTIGRDDNIFDLGGHSLMVLRLFSRIRRAYGVSLPLASLLRAPTIRALGQLIEEQSQSQSTQATDPTSAADSGLIPVQPSGERAPFFCIHGGGGGVLFARHLGPHLSTERPLLAIEAPALGSHQEIRRESVEEIANSYLPILRRRQAQGPYFLGGFSFGGLVAYEMAVQLQAAGEQVAFLALFDTMRPGEQGRPCSKWERIGKAWNRNDATGVIGRPLAFSKRIVHRLASDANPLGPTRSEIPPDPRGRLLYQYHQAAMDEYRAPRYPGRLTLVKASVSELAVVYPDDYGWGDFVSEVDIVDVPCKHLELFDEAFIKAVAGPLEAAMQKADAVSA